MSREKTDDEIASEIVDKISKKSEATEPQDFGVSELLKGFLPKNPFSKEASVYVGIGLLVLALCWIWLPVCAVLAAILLAYHLGKKVVDLVMQGFRAYAEKEFVDD